jgi:dihydroflavonol-4-reductase
VRIFVTGATGFIGGHVARKLLERGDDVVALVREPARASELEAAGATLVQGDLGDRSRLADAMAGCDAAIHGAAVYKVGIPAREHEGMRQANVVGTENALGAALDAKIPKVVYISTVAAFGNTRGEVVDESYEHPRDSYTSFYEQTKTQAHDVAKRLISEGLPAVIVQPGGVYGPGDHSSLGKQLSDFMDGRMPALAFPDLGLNMVHVEDVATGVLLALDRGEPGESYILGGEITTMRGAIEQLADVSGKRAPKRDMPTGMLKAMTPFGPLVGKVMGQPPNLRELISSADGVTFWAKHDKATRELGYSPRPLETGLRETFEAEGKLPASA